MTKVAITGPATGTGTYILRAPDTASTLDFELPITGTHLASAQADGMPLGTGGDPVVESGSNSDGEWTRFADGTQQCYVSGRTLTYSGSAILTYYWNYPLTFFGVPVVLNQPRQTPDAAKRESTHYADGILEAQARLVVINNASNYVSGDSLDVGAWATGRWK